MLWDFKLSEVFSLLLRTLPFLLLRMAIYFGITLAYVLGTGLGGGIGYLAGGAGDTGVGTAFWGALTGFGVVSGVLYWVREYILYLVKAGHIAVLVELMQGKALPEGRNQIEHAGRVVKERFVESSVLFGLDQLIKGVLRVFDRVMFTIAAFLPIPGIEGPVKFINAVIRMSLTFVDEVILAYNIRVGSQNPWASSRHGLVLYAQNYKTMLKNALWLTLILWGLTFVVFLIVLLPVAGLAALFPGVTTFWGFVLAVIFALAIKAAVIEPIAMTALMQVFFQVTESQQPNPEWTAKLEGMSDKFKEMGTRAAQWQPSGSAPAA